jgi:hypothetical protein
MDGTKVGWLLMPSHGGRPKLNMWVRVGKHSPEDSTPDSPYLRRGGGGARARVKAGTGLNAMP